MDELKLIFAANLIKLRNEAGLTQAELGERLNYSDKSVSKWERAESIPDAFVLMQIAQIFGVKVDDMLTSHDEWVNPNKKKRTQLADGVGSLITLATLISIFAAVFLTFVILWLSTNVFMWQLFVYMLPAMLITWLVLNSVFSKGVNNRYLVMAIVLSIFAVVYVSLINYNPWQLFIAAIPVEIVVWVGFVINRRRKG